MRARDVEVARGAVSEAAPVFDVLDGGVNLGGAVEVRGGGGPLALAVVGVGAREDVGRLLGFYLDGRIKLRDRALPEADAEVLAPEQVVVVGLAGRALDGVLELLDGVGVIRPLAGDEAEAEVRLGRGGVEVGGLREVARGLFVAV